MDGPRTGASAVPDKTHGRACFDLDQTAIPAKLIILKRRWGMLAMPDAPVVPAIRDFKRDQDMDIARSEPFETGTPVACASCQAR
ncbi:MAG: hypothetical protein ACJ8EW_18550, partial [Rhizobium sp.]